METVNQEKLLLLKAFNLSCIGYEPLPLQIPIHSSPNRILLISGGEGSGKSYETAIEIVARYPTWNLVYIVGPKYEAAHKEVDYIYEFLLKIGATRKDLYQRPSRGKIVLQTVDGARVETLSAEDGSKAITGTGESPDILAMVEAGKQSYDIYLASRGRVARSRGLLILSGTIESSERWYPELITRWQAPNPEGGKSFILPTWSNTKLYPGGRDDPEIKALEATYPPDQFLERFGAVPVPPSSLVFKEFSHVTHIAEAPYWRGDAEWKDAQVELAIDPGYAGAYHVSAIQWQGDTVFQIDEVHYQFRVAEDVIDECMSRPWWGLVTGGVIDIAGKQHQGQESHQEIWARRARIKNGTQGLGLRSNKVKIAEGIQRHKTFLINPFTGKPRLFHDPRCKNTIREYGQYKYKEVVDGKPVDEQPIDADNHAMKALAYWLYDKFGPTDAVVQAIVRRNTRVWDFAER